MRDRSVVVIAIEFVLTMGIFVTNKKNLDHGANACFKHRISTHTPSPSKNSRMTGKNAETLIETVSFRAEKSHYKKHFHSKLDKKPFQVGCGLRP